MAIHSIGLSAQASESADSSKVLTVRAGVDPTALFLKWRTASGVDVNESFDIALNYRVVPKVTTEGGGISGWATDWGTWAKVRASHCNPQYVDGGWQWSFDFAALLGMTSADKSDDGPFMDGNVDILYDLFYNGGFGFADRYYDRIEFGIRIKSHYVGGDAGADETIGMPGTATTSPRTDATFTIDYVPIYTIQSVYCDTLESVSIEYSCDGWLRTDDRFCLESMRIGVDEEGEGGTEIAASKPWGTVSRRNGGGARIISIPMSALSDIPHGEQVSLDVRFNPSYGTSGEEFARASLSNATCGGEGSNQLFMSSKVSNGILNITASDLGGDNPIENVVMKLVGSDYRFDQQTAPVGEAVAWPFAPRGVPIVFKAFGISEGGGVSDVVTLRTEIDPIGWLTLVPIKDPTLMATASYDIDVKKAKQRESETVKLAGRPRPCTYYGNGGNVSIDASFSIPHQCMVDHPSETEDAWWDVSMAGDCVMLTADGKRAVVTVEDVNYTSPVDDDSVTMAVSLSEVDA